MEKPEVSNLVSPNLVEGSLRDVQFGHNSNWEVGVPNSKLSDIHKNPDMFEIQLNEIDVAIQNLEKSNPSPKNLVLHST